MTAEKIVRVLAPDVLPDELDPKVGSAKKKKKKRGTGVFQRGTGAGTNFAIGLQRSHRGRERASCGCPSMPMPPLRSAASVVDGAEPDAVKEPRVGAYGEVRRETRRLEANRNVTGWRTSHGRRPFPR